MYLFGIEIFIRISFLIGLIFDVVKEITNSLLFIEDHVVTSTLVLPNFGKKENPIVQRENLNSAL